MFCVDLIVGTEILSGQARFRPPQSDWRGINRFVGLLGHGFRFDCSEKKNENLGKTNQAPSSFKTLYTCIGAYINTLKPIKIIAHTHTPHDIIYYYDKKNKNILTFNIII